MHVSN